MKNRERTKWVEVKGGFVESSYETYVNDFQLVVKQHPQEMIELVLENKKRVLSGFIDSMFLGVEMSETLEEVDFKTIEKMLLIFPCDMLHSNALNCVRGRAARTIGHLLWEDEKLFGQFKDAIEVLTMQILFYSYVRMYYRWR